MDIVERISQSLSHWGSHSAFVELTPGASPIRMSASEFEIRCHTIEELFREAGIRDRSTVAMFIENSIDFVAVFIALLRIHALLSAVKLDFRRMELDEVFKNFDPDFVISEESHLPVIAAYLSDRTTLVHRSGGRFEIRPGRVQTGRPDVPDDVASINYTYRGYGYPLGSMTPYAGYQITAQFVLGCLRATPGNRSLVILPMPHIYTLAASIFVPIFGQMTSVIARTIHPRHLLRYIAEEQINYITSVPEIYTMLSGFIDEKHELGSLRALVSGGSRLTVEQNAFVSECFRCEVLHGYGLTEYPIVSAPARETSRPGTMGPPAGEVEWRIAADGELVFRSNYLAAGYYRRPEESREAFSDGWFATGDLIEESEGHLVFVREKKATCKVNGNMVDFAEVERAIMTFPGVVMSRAYLESRALVAEVLFDDGEVDQGRIRILREYLFGIMSPHKVPKTILSTK
ncbi:MAG TPA: class I adenylate-forming enzyme family protein [Spirochaetia bacterium]|nr:class I adenylate-forming enzyme family protein [Spirochaetia bacterium]